MKAYNKILLAGLVTASVLSSCKDDDFLKEEPKTIYTVETAFEKSSQVDAAIARAYISFNYMFGWHNLYVEGAAASWVAMVQTVLTAVSAIQQWLPVSCRTT